VCKPCRNKQSKQQYNEVKHPKEDCEDEKNRLAREKDDEYMRAWGMTEEEINRNFRVYRNGGRYLF